MTVGLCINMVLLLRAHWRSLSLFTVCVCVCVCVLNQPVHQTYASDVTDEGFGDRK